MTTPRASVRDAASGRVPASTLALIAALTVAYAISGYVNPQRMSGEWLDPDQIVQIGRNWCQTGEFAITPGTPTVLRGPAYPMAVAIPCWLTGVDAAACLPLINGLCFFLMLWALARHPLARTGMVRVVGLLAVGLDPLLLNYAGRGYLEPMLLLAVALVITAIDRLVRDPSPRSMLALGVAWGFSLLVKPILIYLALPLLVALAFVSRRGAALALGSFVIALAVISPWTVRNWRRTGQVIPVATGGWEIMLKGDTFSRFVLQADGVEALETMAKARIAALDRAQGIQDLSLAEREPFYKREIMREVRDAPLQYLRKAAVQSINFWVLGGDRRKTAFFAALQIPVLAVFAFALRQRRSIDRHVFLGLAVVGTYLFAVHIVALAIARYSMPLRPWIVLVAATFVAQRLRGAQPVRAGSPVRAG